MLEQAQAGAALRDFPMAIGGQWTESASGRWFESIDPYTGRGWARIPRGDAADVDRAVRAAHAAFADGPWVRMSASERGLLMHRLADVIEANADWLADIEVRDNGKLLAEMRAQMRMLPGWLRYYGGLADKVEGAVTPLDRPGVFHYVTYEPLGVVAAIAPWNSPLLLTMWKLAPALAAGNTIVIKPSEHASASTIALAELIEAAGFPPAVVNVVTGFGNEVGEALVDHPLVAKIAFTGGDVGGRRVYEAAARGLKPVSLELGGKSPNIVFADADLDQAVRGVASGIFAASGQTCMAGSRLLVEASIHDRFVKSLIALAGAARLGDPRQPDTDIGPLSTREQLEKVLGYIRIARKEGAVCVLGGERAENGGWFVPPTIFTGVTNRMRIAREEVFGPVLSVLSFESEDEAVAIANDTPYGLAAGVWTSSLERALQLPRRLQAGTVWVNTYRQVSRMAPFGGTRASGIGRENGARAVFEHLQAKSVFINTSAPIENPFAMRG